MIRNKNEVDSAVGYLRVQGAGCSPWSVLIAVPGHTGHSSPVNIYYGREWQHQSLRPAQPGPAWRPSPNPRPLIKAAARRAGHCAGPRQHQVTTTLQYHITHWLHYPELVSLIWTAISAMTCAAKIMKERMHFIGAEFQTWNFTAELLVKSRINTAVNTDPWNIEH